MSLRKIEMLRRVEREPGFFPLPVPWLLLLSLPLSLPLPLPLPEEEPVNFFGFESDFRGSWFNAGCPVGN
jgi:hypothetical protein